MPDTYSADA